MTDGKELVLMYYIPLDFAFNISRSAFFWYNVFLDKKKMQNDLKLKKRAQVELVSRSQVVRKDEPNSTPGMEEDADDTASNKSSDYHQWNMWYKPSKELTIEKVHEDLQNLQDDRFFK